VPQASCEQPTLRLHGRRQFENPPTPIYHYETTAHEIFEQMEGRIDAITVGSGTAGTFTGIARFLKERLPRVHTVLVETEGRSMPGGQPAPPKVEGMGPASSRRISIALFAMK